MKRKQGGDNDCGGGMTTQFTVLHLGRGGGHLGEGASAPHLSQTPAPLNLRNRVPQNAPKAIYESLKSKNFLKQHIILKYPRIHQKATFRRV